MTFGTTSGHIVFVDGHPHFIMHSSCHHSLLTRFLIRSHTYAWRVWYGGVGGWVGGVFLLEVQYSILKSLISTCVLSYVGSREDWLLDRICES